MYKNNSNFSLPLCNNHFQPTRLKHHKWYILLTIDGAIFNDVLPIHFERSSLSQD